MEVKWIDGLANCKVKLECSKSGRYNIWVGNVGTEFARIPSQQLIIFSLFIKNNNNKYTYYYYFTVS